MKITNYQKLKTAANPHGIDARKIYDQPHGVIMHLELAAGESLKPHITPVDVAFYVLEGNPHIVIGEEEQQAAPDDLIESPRDIVHTICNRTAAPVRVLVLKLPKPGKPTRVQQ